MAYNSKEIASNLNAKYAQLVRDTIIFIKNNRGVMTSVEIRAKLRSLLVENAVEKKVINLPDDLLSNTKIDNDLLGKGDNAFEKLTNSWKTKPEEVIVNRKTYSDGRIIPIEGDLVYQTIPDLEGNETKLTGKIINSSGKLRVQCDDKSYPLNSHWTLNDKISNKVEV